MKFICFGYVDEKTWERKSAEEFNALFDACFDYDESLKKNGHFLAGEALQTTRNAATLRRKDDKVLMTDGPYAETKEQIGGILVLEARDLKQAVELISKHPGLNFGPWEIRPIGDLAEMVRASQQRRAHRR